MFPDPALVPPPSAPPPEHPVVSVREALEPGAARVVLRGEVDVAARLPLLVVRDWLVDHGLTASVDASGVTFMDAAGWSAVRQLTPDGCEPLLHDPSPATRRLLSLLAEARDGAGTAARAAEGLRAGMRSLELTDRAEGILVAQRGWTPDQVQEHLRTVAEREGRSIADVAREVIGQSRRLASE